MIALQLVGFAWLLAQESGSVSSGDVTLGGAIVSAAGNGVLIMWLRQAIKDRDLERVERKAVQAKYDDLSHEAFPLLANAIPALDKVSESMKQAHESDTDELKQALRKFTSQLRSAEKER